MERTAYIVRFSYGNLAIAQVTVERETERSYLLKTVPDRQGNRRHVEQKNLLEPKWYGARVFPKGGRALLFFSRDKAIEKGLVLVESHMEDIRRHLAKLEAVQEQLAMGLIQEELQ